MFRSKPESIRNKVSFYVIFTLTVVFLVMWIFNLSFSLPTTYPEVVERNMKEKGMEREIEQVRIRMNGDIDLDRHEVSPPADDREFLIDQPDQVNRLASEEVRLYAVGNGTRLTDSETSNDYDLHLRFTDGSSLSYDVADTYIQSMNGDFSTYRVLDDENSLFLYIESLYE